MLRNFSVAFDLVNSETEILFFLFIRNGAFIKTKERIYNGIQKNQSNKKKPSLQKEADPP